MFRDFKPVFLSAGSAPDVVRDTALARSCGGIHCKEQQQDQQQQQNISIKASMSIVQSCCDTAAWTKCMGLSWSEARCLDAVPLLCTATKLCLGQDGYSQKESSWCLSMLR